MKQLAFIMIALFSIACNDHQAVKGLIIDKSTRKPIDSVKVLTPMEPGSADLNWLGTFSKQDGSFQLNLPAGDTGHSLCFLLLFSKQGYRSYTFEFTRLFPDTIYLERN